MKRSKPSSFSSSSRLLADSNGKQQPLPSKASAVASAPNPPPPSPPRLVEYFLVVSCRSSPHNNNRGIVGESEAKGKRRQQPSQDLRESSQRRLRPGSFKKAARANRRSRQQQPNSKNAPSMARQRVSGSLRGLTRGGSASRREMVGPDVSSSILEENPTVVAAVEPAPSTSDSHSTGTTTQSSRDNSHDSSRSLGAPRRDAEGNVGGDAATGGAASATGGGGMGNIRWTPDDGSLAGDLASLQNVSPGAFFRPGVTGRYPLKDHPDHPLNPMVVQFCFPTNSELIMPSTAYEMPRVHHFVLTNERGRKIYGTCLTVMEEYVPKPDSPWYNHQPSLAEEDDSSMDESGVELSVVPPSSRRHRKALYLPKVLCLLSTWPYLTAFREYLSQLYRLAVLTDAMHAPVERYVVNLYEIPAPPPGSYEIQLTILNSTIRFWAPPARLPIAYTALPFQILFECLDVDNILKVWSAMLVERKVLLVSSQHSILTVCAEILASLLFPMRWSHLCVPLLPKLLCPILDAPVPYLCGIVRENWLRAHPYVSGDTIVVDLDRNTVVVGGLVYPVPPPPPKKFHKLRSCLLDTVGHIFWRARGQEDEYRSRLQQQKGSKRNLDGLKEDSRQWSEKLTSLDHAFNLAYTPDSPNLLSDALPDDERQQWDRVQSAFLRFFTALFKGYDKFIRSPGPGKFSFDRDGFVASRKGEQGAFLEDLCSTQQFDDFTSRRMYSPGEPDLVFFDQSVNAKLNRSKFKIRKEPTPFLQSAQVHKELKRIPAVEVNLEGLTASRFAYDKWPDEFDPTLFSKPRPVPKMISAEFDRQRDLVSKLRAFDPDADGEDVLVEAHGGDYDESPEVASFTVFFFVYASLVGRDWQEYQRRRSTEVGASQSSQNSSYRDNIPFDCGVAEGIEVVDMSESERTAAVTGCFEDLSMGLCEACPEDSLLALKSAIIYCGDGAQDAYARLFATTAETVAELQLQLSAAAMHQNDEQPPEDAEDALIEYEEAKEVAGAQLDLAFEMLKTMALRALSTDFDAYRSLIEACGRCGDTQRALQLIEMMRNDGFVPDGEVLGCFVAAFAHDGVSTDEGSVEVTVDTSRIDGPSAGTPKSDAYSKYLKKKLASASKGGSLSLSSLSDWRPASFNRPAASPCGPTEELTADAALSETSSVSSTDWTRKSPTGGTAFLDWMSSHYLHHQHRQDGLPLVGGGNVVGSTGPRRRKARKRGRRRVTAGPEATGPDAMHPVTDVVAKQLELSGALLDFLYPDLQLDGSDCCPHCSHELSEADVVAGWTPCSFQDCTSACPKCQFRFVPRFAVSSSSPDFCGSQGPQTPLYCEFLSPWVLRKELQYIIKGTANGTGGNGSVSVGIWGMLKPSWRQGTGIEATLFWNLVMMCRRYRLPYSFLFQSSFQNGKTRLALPRIPVEMF